MSIGFASLRHLKLPLSIKIANCLYLHDSYITKFDFMNYAFAKLVVAWLYVIVYVISTKISRADTFFFLLYSIKFSKAKKS